MVKMMSLLALCTTFLLIGLGQCTKIKPKIFSLPEPPPLIVNKALVDTEILFNDNGLADLPVQTYVRQGSKTFLAALDGWVYIYENGSITPLASISESPFCVQGAVIDLVLCGQPTGMVMGPDDVTLHIADSFIGYITMHSVTGAIDIVLPMGERVKGVRTKFFEDVAVANNGDVYLAEGSTRWSQSQLFSLLVESGTHGRVIKLKANGKKKVVLDKLAYCTSVQLAPDQKSLLVSEFGRARVLRHYIKGPNKGNTVPFAENLPGFPDNIRPSRNGGWWCAAPLVRDQHILDVIDTEPALRCAIRKILTDDEIAALFQVRGMVFELSSSGEVLRVLQDLASEVVGITTEVNDNGSELLIGHYAKGGIAKLEMT